MRIKHPEWLQVEDGNTRLYGYSQEWYMTSFQRTRGCGPTAAAMLLCYLNRREKEALPYRDDTLISIKETLESVWAFVTPGRFLGLNSTKKFCKGAAKLFRHYGLNWQCRRLSVAALKSKRIPLAQVIKFIEEGMASDCPVAFLNLHKGQVADMESWHWTVLVSLVYDAGRERYLATCYDGGREISFDLGLWLDTSRFGGGFVYVMVPAANKKTR